MSFIRGKEPQKLNTKLAVSSNLLSRHFKPGSLPRFAPDYQCPEGTSSPGFRWCRSLCLSQFHCSPVQTWPCKLGPPRAHVRASLSLSLLPGRWLVPRAGLPQCPWLGYVLCLAVMVVTTVQHPVCSGSLPGTKAELTHPCLSWCSLSFLTAHPGSSLGLAQTAGDTARTAGLNRPKGISCTVKHHAQQ